MSAYKLRDHLPHLTWDDLKNGFLSQYSTFHSHAIKALTHLQQGPSEILKMYLHHASELLSKIQHKMDMSQITVEGLNHYTMVY